MKEPNNWQEALAMTEAEQRELAIETLAELGNNCPTEEDIKLMVQCGHEFDVLCSNGKDPLELLCQELEVLAFTIKEGKSADCS